MSTNTEEPILQALADVAGVEPIAEELPGRIESCEASLSSLFEASRNGRGLLTTFLQDASRQIRLRNKAEGRLRSIDPEASVPARPDPAAELHGLVMGATLRRADAVAALRAERVRLLEQTKADLAAAVDGT
jgi:hypothetical protein